MKLPPSEELPVHTLAACFNKTSSSYKFYWFISILQFTEQNIFEINKRDLFAKMLANAWFTVNFFKVSFGPQDLIQSSIYQIKILEDLPIDGKRDLIFERLKNSQRKETERLLWHFDRNVPHWFLSPWFPKNNLETESSVAKRIYLESRLPESTSLYALSPEKIVINPRWREYLSRHTGILKDFCYWNLSVFLQAKNPNVPGIPNKLLKPAIRSSLVNQRKFWDLLFDEVVSIPCIYTGEKLIKGEYAVEHFIPYNFISHDLIWNLIPASKRFNLSKSDKLPILENYFESYFSIHKRAIEIVSRRQAKNKFLEEYLTIFPDLKAVATLPDSFTKDRFEDTFRPLITIAANNGFEYLQSNY